MTKYTYIAEDEETGETVLMRLRDGGETWAPPMELFFRFLKAKGFVFSTEDYIGVLDNSKGKFRGPDDEGYIS